MRSPAHDELPQTATACSACGMQLHRSAFTTIARHTHYSHRSATTGSTREAAIAGRLHAAIAVAATPTHATANEPPSVGWMSYKRLVSTRLVPAADTAVPLEKSIWLHSSRSNRR